MLALLYPEIIIIYDQYQRLFWREPGPLGVNVNMIGAAKRA